MIVAIDIYWQCLSRLSYFVLVEDSNKNAYKILQVITIISKVCDIHTVNL